jgi:hypothetical protein
MGRPARTPQLRSSFAAIWNDVLPPVPDAVWRSDLARIKRALECEPTGTGSGTGDPPHDQDLEAKPAAHEIGERD